MGFIFDDIIIRGGKIIGWNLIDESKIYLFYTRLGLLYKMDLLPRLIECSEFFF